VTDEDRRRFRGHGRFSDENLMGYATKYGSTPGVAERPSAATGRCTRRHSFSGAIERIEMVKIQGATVIARPIDVVFDFVADERNEPKYNPRMVHAEKVTPGPVGKGTRWVATIQSMGRPLDMAMEVTDYKRPTSLGSTTSMSTAEIRGTLTFQPDPAGTWMQWSWELKPKGMFKLLTPVIGRMGKRQEQEIWGGLKRYLESSQPTQSKE